MSQLPCFTSRCTVITHQFGLVDISYRVLCSRSTVMTWSPLPVKLVQGLHSIAGASAGSIHWCIKMSALGVEDSLVRRLELITIKQGHLTPRFLFYMHSLYVHPKCSALALICLSIYTWEVAESSRQIERSRTVSSDF